MTDEVRMLDSAFPPSAASVAAAKSDGIRLWAGYRGQSPHAGVYHVWTQADFERVEAGGIPTVDIWFPPQGFNASDPNAGAEAVAAAKAAGVKPGHIIALDVEAGTKGPSVVDEVSRFSAAVRAAGFRSCAYGLTSFTSLVAPVVDLTWRAAYGAKPSSLSDRDGVQWWNSHNAYGASVDESLVGRAWLSAVLNPTTPVTGGTTSVADLDPKLVLRGMSAWFLHEHGVDPTGPNIDWFLAHAAASGAGQFEWAIEGALTGSDKAEPAAISNAARRLRALGQAQVPPEIVANIKSQL